MPGLSCTEVIASIRKNDGSGMPILILSGEAVETEELRALGADAAVMKPFDVQALVQQIRGYVGKSV